MNQIINCYKNNGKICELINCDYLQIELLGSHGENKNMLVSKSTYLKILDYKWYLNSNGYPATYNFGRALSLHKFLYPNLEKGLVVDHINRDKLDNRLENLRIITQKENSYNRNKNSNSKNTYKGIKKSGNTFTATVNKDGQKYEINNIPDEKEAAKIYDAMAEELFGQYAGKNFG